MDGDERLRTFSYKGNDEMQTKIRVLFVAAIVAALAVIAGNLAANDRTEETTPTETKTTETSTTEPVKFSGTGRQASEKFTLQQGLAIFRVNYEGESNFVVSLMNSEGEEVQTLFNEIGAYEAARGFAINKAGEYLLNVQARGPWTFTIEQPRPTAGETTPKTLTGTRTDVTPFLTLKKGLGVFKFEYKGDGRFAAYLVDKNGRTVEQLVNTLRSYTGSTPVKVPTEGIYFLNVSADGEWQIDIN
jgi:hypothetical protein